MKIWRLRVAHATGIFERKGQHLLETRWRGGEYRGIVQKYQTGSTPGRFKSIGWNGKIVEQCDIVWIQKLRIRQRIDKGLAQQALLLESRKIFTIDPQKIGRPLGCSCAPLGIKASNHRGNIIDLHVNQLNLVLRRKSLSHASDVLINYLRATPRIEVDRLASSLQQCLRPAISTRQRSDQCH